MKLKRENLKTNNKMCMFILNKCSQKKIIVNKLVFNENVYMIIMVFVSDFYKTN